MNSTCCWRFPSWAARTASAMVSELPRSTIVFDRPERDVQVVAAAAHASGYHMRYSE